MDHHSQQPIDPEVQQAFLEQQRAALEEVIQSKLGATGNFPQGKIAPSDEGELMFSVTTYRGQVIVNFGKPIQWAGLNPDQARRLADALIRRAREAERQLAAA